MQKKEKDELARVFKQMDKNGDGRLSRAEIKEGYEIKGIMMTEAEIDKLFDAVDTAESGYIEFTEFVVASAKA